ncbi:putative quinol monooxygenase (plasmid) [Arthrobacter agilis]|uniref:putative quinol monooxygenase n=1 Tax=Arthrobacter agilis TaxID=37921 RepID=UPI0023668AC4|nr:putative quinol monooxygenase [Arthrobacter agilis]WDF35283.1 putative quinol monooxygenase [Arthrobacter agilis]
MPVFEARSGQAVTLGRLLTELAQISRRDEGCITYSVHADVENPFRFVLYEVWGSAESLAAHDCTDHVRRFSVDVVDLLEAPFYVTRLRELT